MTNENLVILSASYGRSDKTTCSQSGGNTNVDPCLKDMTTMIRDKQVLNI